VQIVALLAPWGLDGIAVKGKRERCAHTDAPWPCHNVNQRHAVVGRCVGENIRQKTQAVPLKSGADFWP
jgi:hypothetical protein